MDMDLIYSDKVYSKLNQEYKKLLTPNTSVSLEHLNIVINELQTNGFQMPLVLQNKILNYLNQSKQILDILYPSTAQNSKIHFTNNPFNLICHLTIISIQLSSIELKSAYQMLQLKSNNFILKSIKEMSNYFMNKKIKLF